MFKLVLEKAEEPEIKLPTSVGSLKEQESFRKRSTSALLTTPKPLTVWIITNWKILQEMGIPDHLTCLPRNLYAGQEATESDMEQWPGSKLGKEYVKTVYCHPVYLTYIQSEVKVKSLSCVRLFATPWTIAHQAPPSMGFSRQEYWRGLPFSSPECIFRVHHVKCRAG